MQNEILKPVLATDETAIPRYDIVNPDGSVTQRNVELRLKNEVMQQGTPYDEESVLPATLREKLGLPNSATPADAFEAVVAKAGAKVSMNAPTLQDNIAAGYSIGAMWIRPSYTLYNLAYSKLAENFVASACLVAKDGQRVTATGNGDDKVISVALEHGSATGWLYCVVTPNATAVSAKVIAGTEEFALTVGEANVIKHKYSGTSITFEATYATANDANTSTIVIDNLTVIDEAATLEQVEEGYRDVAPEVVLGFANDNAPFEYYNVVSDMLSHTYDGVWRSDVEAATEHGVPTGSIFWLASETVPSGYLICDGAAVLKADYPKLYAVLGSTFQAETDTQFYLPNLLAAFIRGAGTQKGYKAVFGKTQEATAHPGGIDGGWQNTDKDGTSQIRTHDGRQGGGATLYWHWVRPFNVALTPIIKY